MAREKARERPRDAKAWHDLAEQLLALGETGEAECAARRVIECEPSHLGATTTLANILLNRGALDEAKSLLEPLATSRVDVWHVRTALGAIACKQGRLADARHHLENVVEDSPTALMARLYLARALDLLGDAAKARNHLRQAVELTPSLNEVTDRLAAHGLRGEAHRAFDAGNTRESLRLLVEALKRDPEDPLIHFALGVVMRALNECVRAEESFGRAKALAPSVAAWDAGSWPPVTNE
jgi:tetratricopeptide (TPR) repeat protein